MYFSIPLKSEASLLMQNLNKCIYCFRSPAAGLKQRLTQEETEMEVEPETIEVVDAKGRKQVIEAPVMVPATGDMIEDCGDVEL